MKQISKLYRWSFYNVLTSSHSVYLLLIITIYTYILTSPFQSIAENYNLQLTPITYVFIVNDKAAHLLMLSGYILLLSFVERDMVVKQYALPRVGYVNVAIANLLLLVSISLLYQVVVTVLSHMWLVGITTWKINWGDGWKILSVPAYTEQFRKIFLPSDFLIENYSVMEAIWKTYVLEENLLCFIGVLSMMINQVTRSSLGLILVMAVSLSDVLFYNMFPIALRALSPVSLSMLSTFQEPERFFGITEHLAFRFYAIALPVAAVLYFLICTIWEKKRKDGCYNDFI